jgi:hypothetical protein
MHTTPHITWNTKLRLALADVDETIAEVYTPAEPAMIAELTSFLQEGGKLFMVTGGSLRRVKAGITDLMEPALRQSILVSHCSGAEVWGFDAEGELRATPFYSIYDQTLDEDMKRRWRQAVDQLVDEFGLRPHAVQPKTEFWEVIGRDPLDIMLDDRGPQITLEVVNGHDLTDEQLQLFTQDIPLSPDGRRDLRLAIMQRASELFSEQGVPITPRLGGVFAVDLAIEGSSKTTSVTYVLQNPDVLASIGLQPGDIASPEQLEVWGDKYSMIHGGTDRHISEAVSPTVRSIDFRQENPAEFPEGYNIVIWDGQQHLHHGLLEYLQSRHGDTPND